MINISVFSVALCHNAAGIRGELRPAPPPATPHRPRTEQLQGPHHQGIAVTSSLVREAFKSTGTLRKKN